VPDVASYIECTRTVPIVVGISADKVVERILLERSDSSAEQTGADDQDEIGHYDEENRKRSTTGECVDYEATDEAAYNANDGGNRDGARRLAERHLQRKQQLPGLHAKQRRKEG